MIALLDAHEASGLVAIGAAGSRTKAQLLRDVGVVQAQLPAPQPGKEVLLVCGDRYHFAVCLLAAWGAGHPVALPPNAQPELLRAMAAHEGVQLMLHDADEDIGLDVGAILGDGGEGLLGGLSANDPAPLRLDPGAHIATVWTSGSTGEHQRHPKSAAQLLGEARMLAEHFNIGSDARVLASVPAHHIYGLLFSVLVPLVSGATLVREQHLHAGAIASAAARWDANVLVSVPAHLRALQLLEDGELSQIDRVFSSGAPLTDDVAAMLERRFSLRATEILGSTETGGIASRLGRQPWRPLPGVQISVGEGGRLLVESPFLARDCPRPFSTQDMIKVTREGDFDHLGRMDGVVKVGGKRISVEEVQRRLLEIEGVDDAVVMAVDVGGARASELVTLAVAPTWTPDRIRRELKRWLDPVVVPRRVRLVDAIPRAHSGKVTRRELLALLESTPARGPHLLECRPQGEPSAAEIKFRVRVPRNFRYLRGHFSGFPVLPGVVQLELAGRGARGHWPIFGEVARVLRLKFKRPMRPGDEAWLHLRREGSGPLPRVGFVFGDDHGVFSMGSLEFRLDRRQDPS